MIRFIFLLLICYFLYKLIFNFIIPVSRATKQVKRTMQQMHDAQQQQFRQQQQAQQQNVQDHRPPSTAKEDYIDFEEIKN